MQFPDSREDTMRYMGIDTPGTKSLRTTVECFAIEAGAKDAELVASVTSSTAILPANTPRKEALIYSNSTANRYLWFTSTISLTALTVKLATNTANALPMPFYKGVISGIWDAANGSAQVSEY